MKIVVTINQCEYLANQELVLRDEDEIRRLREVLKSDSQQQAKQNDSKRSGSFFVIFH